MRHSISLSVPALKFIYTKRIGIYCCTSITNISKKMSNYSRLKDTKKKLLSVNNINLSQGSFFSSLSNSPFVVNDLVKSCEDKLKKEEINEASLHAEYIVAHALGISREELFQIMNNPVENGALSKVEIMMNCRLERMPLQYIIGNWDFHSITLKIRPPVFIPRPETEGLVNLCIDALKDVEQPTIMDVCCGSGAISLALLNHFPQLKCVAVDQSKFAVELTLENASDLNLSDRLEVVKGKITAEAFPTVPFAELDLIVSNPPYVLRKDLMNMQPEITRYEDLRALDGGAQGLDVIKPIILHGHHYLKHGGFLLMEIDPCHRYLLPDWAEKNSIAFNNLEFFKDYREVDRYVKLVKS